MKQSTPPMAASMAATRQQIIEQLTQAGFAVTLVHRLSEALGAVQHRPGLLVIRDLMDLQQRQQLVEDLRTAEDGERQPVLLVAPVECLPPERQLP